MIEMDGTERELEGRKTSKESRTEELEVEKGPKMKDYGC